MSLSFVEEKEESIVNTSRQWPSQYTPIPTGESEKSDSFSHDICPKTQRSSSIERSPWPTLNSYMYFVTQFHDMIPDYY